MHIWVFQMRTLWSVVLLSFCCIVFADLSADAASPVRPLVILDAGHGGNDEGTCVQMIQEKRLALMCALMLRKQLDAMGYRVIMTRARDVYISLPQRVSIANKNKASIFVSLHFNAAKNTEAKGVEVFYCDNHEPKRTRASQRLANYVLYDVIDETEARSRGVKKANHHVTRETTMPAILVEGGFLTNREERLRLKEMGYLEKIALGVAKGIDKFLKTTPT